MRISTLHGGSTRETFRSTLGVFRVVFFAISAYLICVDGMNKIEISVRFETWHLMYSLDSPGDIQPRTWPSRSSIL